MNQKIYKTEVELNTETNRIGVKRVGNPLLTLNLLIEGVATQAYHAADYKEWTHEQMSEYLTRQLSEALAAVQRITHERRLEEPEN